MHTSWIAMSLLPCCVVALEACSGSDSHRQTAPDASADGPSGGTGNATGGSGGKATGGTASGGQGGQGGSGGLGGSGGGQGGAGGGLPEGGLAGGVFFSVARGATGLAGTGVTSLTAPEGAIFASNGNGPTHVAGTNVVGVTAAQLGLLDTDDLNDIAVLKPVPVHPLYHFSIARDADGAGYTHTDVDRSFLAGELPGDVFVSDGIGQHYDGEGGRRPGFNALTIDEARLGLSTAPGGDAGAGSDDLDALELGVTGVPSKIYFTVAGSAVGTPGSPLAATAAAERGCTIFESTLNGTHKKAYSCANLGLLAGDEVDALAVHGANAPQQILFSVKIGAVGGAGTAVATEASLVEAGGDVFRSPGDGTNELLVDEAGLGLNTTDELDALAVTDEELTPRFDYQVGSCGPLTPNPRNDVGGTLAYDTNWRAWLSTSTFVIGRAPRFTTSSVELLAYDVSTCAQVGTSAVLNLAADGGLVGFAKPLAIVPRAGWSKATPFANVEIWGLTESSGVALVRFPAGGGPAAQIVQLPPTVLSTIDMVYRTASDDFAILFTGSNGKRVAFVKRPAANAANAAVSSIRPVPFPCEEYAGFMGYDPVSNGIEIAHNNTAGKRICSLDSELWFREPPRPWLEGPTPDGGGVPPFRYAYEGFIVPGEGVFGISTVSAFDLVTLRPVP
jgi:hypothetical protein